MIIVLKKNYEKQKAAQFLDGLKERGFKLHLSEGDYNTIVGLIGDTSKIDPEELRALDFVENVTRVSEPFKAANRKFHGDDTVIAVGGKGFGGGLFSVIAGPCSVESEKQIIELAKQVKKSGASYLRGGAFKPRTSPYAFQGMGNEGIKLLLEAKAETGLPIVTEVMSIEQLKYFENVDVVQVGARNMQNFELLKELGHWNKPVLLKRGLSNTIEELLMSAEYIMAGGNENIILCERGIRTFEKLTRNTLDLSAIPLIKKLSHLPVVVDPSHAAGISALVRPLAKAAVAVGADGLMIEVHGDPQHALCDGAQSVTPDAFNEIMKDVRALVSMENKCM